jgi:probable phosphoglycerate mutase
MAETSRGTQWDPPLSEEGRRQADLLARRLLLMDPPPAAVYSSPLRRARETASAYAEAAGLEVALDDGLAEAHIGAWEAMSFEEILASDDELLERLRDQRAIWSRAPGGEDGAGFRARVVGAVERALSDVPDGDVLVFCHGGVINAYCGEVLGLRQEMFFLPENTSVNSVDVVGGDRRIRFLNDIVHLTDPHLFET